MTSKQEPDFKSAPAWLPSSKELPSFVIEAPADDVHDDKYLCYLFLIN